MFFEIVVLKNFSIFTGKYLCWSFFLIKLLTTEMFILGQDKQYLFPPERLNETFFDDVAWFCGLVYVYLRYSSDIENILL